MRRAESPHPWRERRHQVGHLRLSGFGDDLVVRARGRSSPAACHAIEISPCPSPCRGDKARWQDEDEMAPPQKIPQSCSLHCGAGGRGLAPWSALHEAPLLPALLGCLTVVLCGNISSASTCTRRRLPPLPWASGRSPKLTPLMRAGAGVDAAPTLRRHDSGDWAGKSCTVGHEEFTILHSNVRVGSFRGSPNSALVSGSWDANRPFCA